ncbi:MAG: MFS transporter [Candidatus Pacearchaeota archaeon]
MDEIINNQIEEKKQKTLKYSIQEGSATAVMSGAGEAYITPFALALNASNAQVGFLSSFVGLFGASAQIIGSKLVYRYKRKKLIVLFVALQATIWLLLALLGILAWKGIINGVAASILILIYSLYSILGNFAGPPYFSLMGDLVPEKKRGAYFSRKSKIVGAVALVVTFFSALFLDYSKQAGLLMLGFITLFILSSAGRYISTFLFTKHYEPESKMEKGSYFSFWQFIKKAPHNNYGKFVFYIAFINFAVNFSGPFFAVYMLKDLSFNYLTFTLVNIAGSLFTIIFLPLWGKIGDIYGNKKLLAVCSVIITINPILWLLSPNPLYLIFFVQLVSGLGWAGFNLGASNFIYDAVTPQRRAICVAYHTFISGIGVFLGASLGGLFAQYIGLKFINIFLLIFLISGILRGIASLIFIPMIKEVRKTPPPSEKLSFITYLTLITPHAFYTAFRGIRNNLSFISESKAGKEKIPELM